MSRILVIRGGAIGDFILTLPTLKALRCAYSRAHIEILGYKHIAVLAENRFYAQAVRSIEYGPLASFFAKNSDLPAELANYFASFDLIISYLYDPDGVFEMNLRRCGVDDLIHGPGKIDHREHATRQLSRPLQTLGLCIEDLSAKLFPSAEDRRCGQRLARALRATDRRVSSRQRRQTRKIGRSKIGSSLEIVCSRRTDFRGSIVVISGEADADQIARLQSIWKDATVRFAENLPLPHLAAVLEETIFIGHDSGISHLGAAAGANCVLLFGPTDPAVWAPVNENVRVLQRAR